MIADPVLEVVRVTDREQFRFQIGEQAQGRPDDAEFDERFEGAQWISEEFAVVINARRTRAHEHVVRQNLSPEILDRLRFREKAVPADVEVKTFVSGGAGNSTDVNGIGLEDGDRDVVLGKEIRGRQSRRSRADNRYLGFHFLVKPPSYPS